MKNIFIRLITAAVVPVVIFASAFDADAKENKHKNWLEDKMEDIREDYDKAIRKIEKSSFSDEQKKILTDQAAANRDLTESQVKAVSDQMMKNREARKSFKDAIRADKENRKAVKEVDDIL